MGWKIVWCYNLWADIKVFYFYCIRLTGPCISILQLAPFDPTKKKKKKKVVIQDSADDSVDKLAEKTVSLSGVYSRTLYTCLLVLASQSTLWNTWRQRTWINFVVGAYFVLFYLKCSLWWAWEHFYWFEKEEEETSKQIGSAWCMIVFMLCIFISSKAMDM